MVRPGMVYHGHRTICIETRGREYLERKMKNKYYIKYFSKSDGKKIKRPYDPNAEMQHEFIARSGNLCKRYWDESKEGLRTANAPWTIEVRK